MADPINPNQIGYPQQQGGYPPYQGYPPHQGGSYPPQQGGYPPPGQRSSGKTGFIVGAALALLGVLAALAFFLFNVLDNEPSTYEAKRSSAPSAQPTSVTPSSSGTASNSLESDLAQQVAALRSQLPLRSGPITIVKANQMQNTIRLDADIALDLNPAQWQQFKAQLNQAQCQGPEGALIRRGARMMTYLRDSSGEIQSVLANCS